MSQNRGMEKYFARLGIFTVVGIIIIVGFSFYVNDKPFWYSRCNYVDVAVDDATGLRRKSTVKTLGLNIGYITSVSLAKGNVLLTVCITAPIGLRPDTKAYVRTLGFLGDRFLELRPVDIHDSFKVSLKENKEYLEQLGRTSIKIPSATIKEENYMKIWKKWKAKWEDEIESKWKNKLKTKWKENSSSLYNFLFPTAFAARTYAQDRTKGNPIVASREKELSDAMENVDELVKELAVIAKNFRIATEGGRLKKIIINLDNSTDRLAKLLEFGGKDSQQYAGRIMGSLQNSMEGLEKAFTALGRGEGSIGKFLIDEELYEQVIAAVKKLNDLLGKANNLKTFVDMSFHHVEAYDGSKAHFSLKVEPSPSRYYLLGISTDPRGKEERTITEIIRDGASTVEEKLVREENGLKFTLLFGKYYGPFDLSIGLKENAGTLGLAYWLDPKRRLGLSAELYKDSNEAKDGEDPLRTRFTLRANFFKGLYVKAGVEDIRKSDMNGKIPYFFGIGISFLDSDIKYLLAFR